MSPQSEKETLVVHVCCAPCATVPVERLRERYDLQMFFFGPNIHPAAEARRRLDEVRRFCDRMGVGLVVGESDPDCWEQAVGPYAAQSEGSHTQRCQACYRLRMQRTAELCRSLGIGRFTVTLSLSRHKDSRVLARIGAEVAAQAGLDYLPEDFKKRNGQGISVRRSNELGLYRQDYCGCRLSLAEAEARRRARALAP